MAAAYAYNWSYETVRVQWQQRQLPLLLRVRLRDDDPLPKGTTKSPYIDMKLPTHPRLDPGIENEIVGGILARQAERDKLEARRTARRKNILVFAALLLLTLLLYLFFRWRDAQVPGSSIS